MNMDHREEMGGSEDDTGGGVPDHVSLSAESDVTQLTAELEEARDRLLRTTAELENTRKRASRELQEERRFAELPLVRDLLPLVDNVQRAIEAAEKANAPAALLEGVKMVAQQLESILTQHHCVRIAALGLPFDPHVHQAISQLPSPEPAGNVIAVAAAGFQLHDRVVRPSQVVVSSGPG